MESRFNIISIVSPLKWLMQITLVVVLIMVDVSLTLPTSAATVDARTEIVQSSSKYGSRMLSYRAAHNGFTRSFFLAIQVVKGFAARIFHHGIDVSTSVKIASERFVMRKADCECFYAYFFLVTNSEESHPPTHLKG